MARVSYEDCSGQSSSVDKSSTFEVCSNNPNSFQYDPSLWRVEEVGMCSEDKEDEDPLIPAGKYFQLVPCDDTPVAVYTQRQPSVPNERVGISNPQDVGVSGTVNWTYNGQSTNVDNPGVFALSVISKNTSGCTDSEIDEPDDNGLGQNPYQIEIRTNLNSGVASLNINGSQRSISTSNKFRITNANPVSANDFRNVPTLSYSVGDVVEVTESSGEVQNYTVFDVEERSFKGGTQSIKKLSRGESLQYIGQAVNFNVIYTIYLEASGDVIDTEDSDPPVTGGPDGNTTDVLTGLRDSFTDGGGFELR